MAKKLDRKPKEAPAKGASPSTEELAVLHPEQSFTLAGREITVREYGHIEGLRLLAWAQPFADALYECFPRGSQAPSVTVLSALLAKHATLVRDMAAQAADVEPEWVEGLRDVDGDRLLMAWWQVNSGFFFRRLLGRAAVEKLQERQRAGAGSTPPSSAPASGEPQTISGG